MRPFSSCVFSPGWVLITRPSSTESDGSRRASVLKPASFIRFSATSCLRPATPGTVAFPGPLETMIVTVEPSRASSPGCGSCVATRSSGTVSDWTVSMLTSKPAFWSRWEATAERLPTTSGTGFFSGASSR